MDIVTRLRDMQGKKYNRDWSSWVQKMCSEAADEIERLRRLAEPAKERLTAHEQESRAWPGPRDDSIC